MRIAALVFIAVAGEAVAQGSRLVEDEADGAVQLRELASTLDKLTSTVRDYAQVPNADRLQVEAVRDALPVIAQQAMVPLQRVVDVSEDAQRTADGMSGMSGITAANEVTDDDLQRIESATAVARRMAQSLDTFITEGTVIEANATGLMNWLSPKAKRSREVQQLEKVIGAVRGLLAKSPGLKRGVDKAIASAETNITTVKNWRAEQAKQPKRKSK